MDTYTSSYADMDELMADMASAEEQKDQEFFSGIKGITKRIDFSKGVLSERDNVSKYEREKIMRNDTTNVKKYDKGSYGHTLKLIGVNYNKKYHELTAGDITNWRDEIFKILKDSDEDMYIIFSENWVNLEDGDRKIILREICTPKKLTSSDMIIGYIMGLTEKRLRIDQGNYRDLTYRLETMENGFSAERLKISAQFQTIEDFVIKQKVYMDEMAKIISEAQNPVHAHVTEKIKEGKVIQIGTLKIPLNQDESINNMRLAEIRKTIPDYWTTFLITVPKWSPKKIKKILTVFEGEFIERQLIKGMTVPKSEKEFVEELKKRWVVESTMSK